MWTDAVNPTHYKIANDVQLIELIRLMPFSMGNAIKYCYRNGDKENAIQDLKKALWYLKDYYGNSIIVPIDTHKIQELSKVVFSGLPEWEKNICMNLTKYFMNVVDYEDSKIEDNNNLYLIIVENINERISLLSKD